MQNRILAPFFVFIYCCFLSEEYCCSSPFGYENVIQIMRWIIAWLLALYVGAVFLYEKEGETRRETTRSSTTNGVSLRPIDRVFRLMRQMLLKKTIVLSCICLIKLFFLFLFPLV